MNRIIPDVSNCPLCMSDRIYEIDDGDGLCVSCGNILPGPVKPSVGYYEFMRLKGLLPAKKNDPVDIVDKNISKETGQLPRVLQEAVDSINKSTNENPKNQKQVKTFGSIVSDIADGIINRAKNAIEAVANSVKSNEKWSVGPCILCQGQKPKKIVGVKVTQDEYEAHLGKTKKRYTYIRTDEGSYHFGCCLCSKKI